MTNKRFGALVSLSSLAAGLLSVGLVGCSLESNEVSQSTFSKRTYVRAHPRSTTRTMVPRIVKARRVAAAQRSGLAMQQPSVAPAAKRASVLKFPSKANFQGYAVAYAKPHAMVQDSSIIPFALKSEGNERKRFELPFFKKSKSKRQEIESNASRLERLANAQTPIHVRTTAYTHNESDHLKYGRKTALGTRLRFGKVRSAAADWSRYPVGTQFRIKDQPGILYEVDDYGSALVGTGTIDLYKPSFSAMNRWGVRHVDIEVVKWGSFAKSLHIMKPRAKFSHIRKMLASIYKKGTTEEARLTALMMVHDPS